MLARTLVVVAALALLSTVTKSVEAQLAGPQPVGGQPIAGQPIAAQPGNPGWAPPGSKVVESSTEVLQDLMAAPVNGIPTALLAEARAVAIIPNTIKVGLIVGGQRGRGVVVIHEADGNWRAPTFVTITGGSIGFQIGAQGTDVVLVFKTQKSVEGLLRGKFTIGADAAAAAGPVGRRVEAATDAQLRAEIYSYSRTRGLFAGISVDGSVLEIDNPATAAYYANAQAGIPEAAQKLMNLIIQLTGPAGGAVAMPMGAAVPIAAAGVAPAAAMPVGQQGNDPERIRQNLAQAALQLNGRLDDTWRRYLALPAEVYRPGTLAPVEGVKMSLSHFDTVASDARYRMLSDQREFQNTRSLLQAYYVALSAQGRGQINLPPPPPGASR
ncbi:MAG: lipid-binding SYLF domain-containing protein [Planctomycetia bacterium]|nr:lipid-binding SYLF domain-containing protein [Planctomycetia bacterium]